MDTLMVVDEVQTGLGRIGKLFACDREGVTPDVMTLAKALGGGLMPVGACLCTETVYNEEFALRHSSTFAGNTLACHAGLATLELLEKNEQFIVRQVNENGRYLKQELLNLQKEHPDLIKSVRGKGYMLGLQLNVDALRYKPGLLMYLAEQELLTYLITGYLLNAEKIRTGGPNGKCRGYFTYRTTTCCSDGGMQSLCRWALTNPERLRER
jgi:acetylornithine/succinyldiaminopimelate/putrescine aminotransferase